MIFAYSWLRKPSDIAKKATFFFAVSKSVEMCQHSVMGLSFQNFKVFYTLLLADVLAILANVDRYQQINCKSVKTRFDCGSDASETQNCLTIYLNCKDYAIDSKYYNSMA